MYIVKQIKTKMNKERIAFIIITIIITLLEVLLFADAFNCDLTLKKFAVLFGLAYFFNFITMLGLIELNK